MEYKIAYTRGRKLHIGRFEPGARYGHTLCHHPGYKHPRFAGTDSGLVLFTLRMNGGCALCERAYDKEGL